MLSTAKLEMGKSSLKLISKRFYAASAQPKRVSPTERPFLPDSTGLKFTRLPSGLFLVTVDNRAPIARISLIFKAGSRYETTETKGVVHRLRNLIGLSTSARTAVDFNYDVAKLGGVLSSTATRDHLSFDIQIPRDFAGAGFHILSEIFADPLHINERELEFSTPQMWFEKRQLPNDWPAYAYEKLHKVAYRRDGLANSLLAPKYSIGKHTAEQLTQFASQFLVTGNATLIATGVDHEDVLKFASNKLTLRKGSAVKSPSGTKFYSGDIRKGRPNTDLAMVYIGGPMPGLADLKGTIAAAVLANVLGTGPTVKWSEGGQSRLARAARKATSNPFYVLASNQAYEDTGIFSIYYAAQWDDSAAVAKALVGEVRSTANGVSEEDLKAAKNRLKYRLLTLSENDDYVIEDLGVQAAVRQSDIHPALDQAKLIDSISVGDVQKVAKQLCSGKFAISAIGRLDKTPYVDELVG